MSVVFFWAIVFLISLHYFFFPIAVVAWARFRPRPPRKSRIEPTVSLVIAALDEEKVISEKITNSLAIEYPRTKLEILVVSDGSTDRTREIARSFEKDGVISVHENARRGKTAALNRAVAAATHDIILFSDANSFYAPDILRHLTQNVADEAVGGVSGRKAILTHGQREAAKGDRFFWNFESRLKTAESDLGSIPTGDGEIFAIRRSAFRRLDETLINDDMAITLDLVSQGLRVVYEPAAVSQEQASATLAEDFRVKARMVYGGFQILARYRAMLLPPTTFFAFQFLVHKTLRHLMPVLLISLLAVSALIVASGAPPGYAIFLGLQLAFYLSAALGFYPSRYYCYMNLAALRGLFYFITKPDGVSIWKKAER